MHVKITQKKKFCCEDCYTVPEAVTVRVGGHSETRTSTGADNLGRSCTRTGENREYISSASPLRQTMRRDYTRSSHTHVHIRQHSTRLGRTLSTAGASSFPEALTILAEKAPVWPTRSSTNKRFSYPILNAQQMLTMQVKEEGDGCTL